VGRTPSASEYKASELGVPLSFLAPKFKHNPPPTATAAMTAMSTAAFHGFSSHWNSDRFSTESLIIDSFIYFYIKDLPRHYPQAESSQPLWGCYRYRSRSSPQEQVVGQNRIPREFSVVISKAHRPPPSIDSFSFAVFFSRLIPLLQCDWWSKESSRRP
jgi:hypothetical protein